MKLWLMSRGRPVRVLFIGQVGSYKNREDREDQPLMIGHRDNI